MKEGTFLTFLTYPKSFIQICVEGWTLLSYFRVLFSNSLVLERLTRWKRWKFHYLIGLNRVKQLSSIKNINFKGSIKVFSLKYYWIKISTWSTEFTYRQLTMSRDVLNTWYWAQLTNKKNGAEGDLILPCSFWYLHRFLRYKGSKNLKNNTPPPLILGKHCPDCAVQGRLSIPSKKKIKKINVI